jgi:hypothetical protein
MIQEEERYGFKVDQGKMRQSFELSEIAGQRTGALISLASSS